MSTKNARVLFALKTLRENGINTVVNVDEEIERQEESYQATPADYLVSELRDFLEVQDGDVHRCICQWVSQQGWFWNCLQAYPEISELFSAVSSSEADDLIDDEENCPEPAHAEDVIAAASLLQTELSSISAASANVSLDILNECSTDFSSFIDQSKTCVDDHDVETRYVNYPVQRRGDAVMGDVYKKILLQSSFSMSTSDKEVELIVNLIGEGPEGEFTNFTIVTSQGEMRNLNQPELHSVVTNVASVQRCYTLASALNTLQRTMLSVAEHLISIAPQEFPSSIESTSVDEIEYSDFEQDCDQPPLTPRSHPSTYLSAFTEDAPVDDLVFAAQESNGTCCPLTPLLCPQ